jgi:small-conductance mechanosensitive channel
MTLDNSKSWLLGIGIAAGVWLVGWLLVRLLLAWLPGLLRRSKTEVDDLLFAALKPHLPLWFLALGLVIGVRRAPVPPSAFAWIDRGVAAVVILSASLALASFLVHLIRSRSAPGLGLLSTNTLIENTIRVAIVGLGILAILGEMGVAITPLLTALGVGSLALALALQPTLTNLFAGFHITLARLIRVGDYVELDNGQRGYVVDINWRSTLIRELADNTIVLPNSRLAEMIVKNYSLPGEEHGVTVNVTVAYGADLERAQEVAMQAAREVQRATPGAVADAEPSAQYAAFQDSGVQLGVFLRVQTVRDRVRVSHEFIQLVHRRFREAGIEIPLPQRVVHVHPTGADEFLGASAGAEAPAPPAPRS